MLRYAGALPSEKRAQEMTDGDYLYCLMHEMLDREETLERLCSACGTPLADMAGGGNASFDMERFLRMKGGKRC